VSTTTDIVERYVSGYVGLVVGEADLGANVSSRDLIAGLRDINRYAHGRQREATGASRRDGGRGDGVVEAQQAEADAVIGVDVDYESIQLGQGGSMLMVSASGTIVKL
jgi:uncharacterized protein YbjQ (UPF0145 family)